MAAPVRTLVLALVLAAGVAAPAHAIVGGSETQRDWPHMAGLEFRDDDGSFGFTCGGSLVRPDVVLTAAHCVDDRDREPARFRVLLGTRDRQAGGERIAVTQVVEHPGWDASDDNDHDVALLKLERASSLGTPIPVAGPADAGAFEPGDEATIIGWGATVSGGDTVRTLREGRVPIVDDTGCAQNYMVTASFDPPTMICAGNLTGGEDTCQGDSGGPLMVPGAGGRFVLVGDTSFGVGCAFPTQYGVYGEVAGDRLRPWVEQNAEALSPSTAPPTTGPPSGGQPGGGTPAASGVRLRLPRILGSAGRARARRRVGLRVRSTAPVRRVRVVLRQRGRVVAAGARSRIRRSGRVTLRPRAGRRVRAGRARLTVTARDAQGRRVRASRRVTLRR